MLLLNIFYNCDGNELEINKLFAVISVIQKCSDCEKIYFYIWKNHCSLRAPKSNTLVRNSGVGPILFVILLAPIGLVPQLFQSYIFVEQAQKVNLFFVKTGSTKPMGAYSRTQTHMRIFIGIMNEIHDSITACSCPAEFLRQTGYTCIHKTEIVCFFASFFVALGNLFLKCCKSAVL